MLRAKFAIIALAGIVTASVAARAENIDFTLLSAGTTVTNQYPGVVFSLQGGPDSTGAPMVWSYDNGGLANCNSPEYPTANILDIAFTSPVSSVSFTFDNNGSSNVLSFYTALSGATVVDTNSLPHNDDGELYLVTVNGSGITDLQLNNGQTNNQSWYFQMGELTFTPEEVAPTPEPSSFLLLGSGVLGMAGMLRRKFLAR